MSHDSHINIAILASGSGTNALNFINYFEKHPRINISKIYTNNADAGVIERCFIKNTPCHVFTKSHLKDGLLLDQLLTDKIDYIVLAGFMTLIPKMLVQAYNKKIFNIHPALLPSYGGKGMYGDHVHNAVINAKEKESGITIHLVNEVYDDGAILHQERLPIANNDTPASLANKIHTLEYTWYPQIIEKFILKE